MPSSISLVTTLVGALLILSGAGAQRSLVLHGKRSFRNHRRLVWLTTTFAGNQYRNDGVEQREPPQVFVPPFPALERPFNPLAKSEGQKVERTRSRFRGRFSDPNSINPVRAQVQAESYDRATLHNFITVEQASGAVVETRFPVDIKMRDQVDVYLKALMQYDKTSPQVPGWFVHISAFDPGRTYSCTNSTDGGKECTKLDAKAKRELEKRYIFGADGRTRIGASSRLNFPYRTVGIVGNHCTGTLIGPRHVLTNGHCVHSGPGGDWIRDLRYREIHFLRRNARLMRFAVSETSFRPAYDEDASPKAPYGRLAWARATTKTAWTSSGNFAW